MVLFNLNPRPIQIDFYTVETQQDFKDLFVLDLQEEMERLSDVQNLVMQLYEALHVNEHQLKKERQLVTQLEQLHTQLLPLEEVLQDFLKNTICRILSKSQWVALNYVGNAAPIFPGSFFRRGGGIWSLFQGDPAGFNRF